MVSRQQKQNIKKNTYYISADMDIRYIGGDIPWSLSFGDHFHPQKNSNELETIARRHGFDQLIASEQNVKWSNAGVYFTNKTIDSNATEFPNTDFHDHHSHTFCYLCSVIPYEYERTKPRDEDKRRKLIPYENPKARLSSSVSLNRIVSNTSTDLISYRFIVRTGTQKNSGTRAQVFLYMYGTEKEWLSIHLQGRANSNPSDGFPSGSIRTFCLKGPDIGQLHHLNVNLVGSRSDKEWFLKEIEVTNLNTSATWLCEFNCWLPKANDEEIKHMETTIPRPRESSLSVYILTIRTGEKAFTDPDTTIQVTVRGSTNQTHRLPLTSIRTKLFEQNQLDTFAIVDRDLGDLLEIIIESDKSQSTGDWDIKEMTMWRIIPSDNHEPSLTYFPVNTRFGRKINTLKVKRETYPLVDEHLKGPISYEVIVKTGKVMNAGTDANVFLIIYGKNGRTVVHQLDNRSKNDFERNTSSEFNIMDMDIGKIDRIKVWHDNSNPGSAWFLDSVIIRKNHSTCHTISNVYNQRLEQISQALYRQMKKNPVTRTTSADSDERRSMERQNAKSKDFNDRGSIDRLGSSRGILRSPTIYDRANLQKKVTWDEQSIGSQDDLLAMEIQRSKPRQTIDEEKHKKHQSLHQQIDHFDHQIYWISSHNYTDKKWKIKSIEEINSFDFSQSIRSLLLSDRSTVNNQMRTAAQDDNDADEIYEFQANRWLAKDKEDGKLEVYLTPKSNHKLPITSERDMHSKKTHPISTTTRSDVQGHKHDNRQDKSLQGSKYSSSHDLGPTERSRGSSTPRDQRISPTPPLNISKTHLNDSPSSQQNIGPFAARQHGKLKQKEETPRINRSGDKFPSSSLLGQHPRSSRNINSVVDSLSSEQELLARLTGEVPVHPRSSAASLTTLNQRSKLPRSINDLTDSLNSEQEQLSRVSREPPHPPRSSATSLSPLNQRSRLSRDINDLTDSLNREHEPPHRPRSSATSLSPLNQRLQSPRSIYEQEPLVKISREPPNHSRLGIPPTSSSNQRLQSSRTINDIPHANERESLSKISDQRRNHPHSTINPILSSVQNTKSPRNSNDRITPLINSRNSTERITDDLSNYSQLTPPPISSSNQRLTSPRSNNKLAEQELLTRITGESTYRSQPSTTLLSPLNQRAKLSRSTNDSTNTAINERETFAQIPSHSRSSNQFSKPIRPNNESNNSLTRTSIEPSLRPKSAVRSSSQKSIFDQIYNSAYGTKPSDDF